MAGMTRRTLIGAGTAALVTGESPAQRPPSGASASGPTRSTDLPALTVDISFPGGVPTAAPLHFDLANGSDIGNYTAPSASFTQRCIRVRHASLPFFFVDFRPDISGGRVEVVFWNGECLGTVPTGYSRDLPAYNAAIKNSGVAIHREAVPFHHWGTRWRYQSATRPVLRSAAQVFAEGWLPHMSKKAARIQGYSGVIVPAVPRPLAKPTWGVFQPIDNPAGATNMGLLVPGDTGGERPEIGLVTEWQADYLLNGTAASLNTLIQQAEMMGSECNSWYIPDQVTNAPINYKQDIAHYRAHMYNTAYGDYYWIRRGTVNSVNFHDADTHIPSCFYIPYALTEDPFYIEAQQFVCQYGIGWGIYQRENVYGGLATDPTGASGLNGAFTVCSYTGQIRSLGWGIRNLACAYKMSPANPPSWMLPRSYYAACSADYSQVINKLCTTNGDTLYQIFGQLGPDNYWQAFEQAYGIMGMSLADLVGMPTGSAPSWNSQLTFYFRFFDGITNGTSGWNRQCPQPHDLDSALFSSVKSPSKYYHSWTDAWNGTGVLLKKGATFPNAASPGNQQGGSMGNCSQIAAACACAKSRGVPAATGALNWMNSFIDFNYPNNADASMGIAFSMKCGFDGR